MLCPDSHLNITNSDSFYGARQSIARVPSRSIPAMLTLKVSPCWRLRVLHQERPEVVAMKGHTKGSLCLRSKGLFRSAHDTTNAQTCVFFRIILNIIVFVLACSIPNAALPCPDTAIALTDQFYKSFATACIRCRRSLGLPAYPDNADFGGDADHRAACAHFL